MIDTRMDRLLDVLDTARQRVTYGAAASLLGQAPRTLMKGRDRDARHSWVVNRRNGEPTGYQAEMRHPDLKRSDRIIETREELEKWLATQPLGAGLVSRAA
ncbi:MAG: hypothetical protein JWM95_5614 [Gemmatimonadetes bacterium]|nr:hypothetical protein [Gemmatimonadota bacterium]